MSCFDSDDDLPEEEEKDSFLRKFGLNEAFQTLQERFIARGEVNR
jgi:hypothetical protein